MRGFLVTVTTPLVELVFLCLLFFFFLWLCSLADCPFVLFSIQKLIVMSKPQISRAL